MLKNAFKRGTEALQSIITDSETNIIPSHISASMALVAICNGSYSDFISKRCMINGVRCFTSEFDIVSCLLIFDMDLKYLEYNRYESPFTKDIDKADNGLKSYITAIRVRVYPQGCFVNTSLGGAYQPITVITSDDARKIFL